MRSLRRRESCSATRGDWGRNAVGKKDELPPVYLGMQSGALSAQDVFLSFQWTVFGLQAGTCASNRTHQQT